MLDENNNIDDSNVGNGAVGNLLSAMKRVGVPADFDVRVRSRIAAARPAQKRGFNLRIAIRYAFPLVLLLVVGTFFGLRTYFVMGGERVPVLVESRDINAASLPLNSPVVDTPTTIDSLRPVVIAGENSNSPRVGIKSAVPLPASNPRGANTGGTSYVEAGNAGMKIYPRGINPNSKVGVKPGNLEKMPQIAPKEILEQMGVGAKFADTDVTVESIKENTIASRAGLKIGDVIEAINDQPITEKRTFGGQLSVKTIKIRREGKLINVDLQPR